MVVGDFSKEADTILIGAGPGGYVAAIRAAQLGQKVIIIEKEHVGGVCLNEGCIPSKALISTGHDYVKTLSETPNGISYQPAKLDFGKMQDWKNNTVVSTLTKGVRSLLKKNKVEIVEGEAFFTSANTLHVMQGEEQGISYSFNNCIIATGSRPIQIPNFEFSDKVLDSTGLLNLKELPERLVMVGGGYIGMELALAYANLGSKVTVLEGMTSVLNAFEKDLVKPVLNYAKKVGMEIITNAKAKSVQDQDAGLKVVYEVEGQEQSIEADMLAVVVGRRPNTDNLSLELAGVKVDERGFIPVDQQGKTNQAHIYAIGDIVAGPALAHKASYEGKVAAAAIAGDAGAAVDYQVIPTVCYTSPEIAVVGLTEAQAKEKGMAVKKATFHFAGNGRALSKNETEGFIRLISEKESKRIVGAQMVGQEVAELIGEVTLAIENLMTAEDIVLTIHNHPSLGEAIMDTSEVLLGQGIHQ